MAAVAVVLLASGAQAATFCVVVAPDGAPGLVAQAAAELSAGLERLTEKDVPVVDRAPAGTPRVVLSVEPGLGGWGEEEYELAPRGGEAKGLTIRGRTPLAVLHGAYRLLREYGVGEYFDGSVYPGATVTQFLTPTVHAAPTFAIRGSLPWYNFLNSPTTWDDQDFRFFADQILRSGQNFIGFHTYDYEPFAAYEQDGQVVGGEPLMTTANSVWGTTPLRVDEFGFGTGRLFPGEFWGSDAARMEGNREARIAAQKALLARGLAYASARGVKTCLGFEVHGDPTHPDEQRRFRARLTALLRDYPMLDYVWLWQSEGRSMEGSAPPALRDQAARLYREWEGAFGEIDTPARRWEGMRMAGYGRLAREYMDEVAPGVKLVLSGWGGDRWLHVSDYYPCWDRVLDKRIIFAALGDISVGPQVAETYRLPADRERWAIPWYEYDGDQWFPQANAHIFDQTIRDARAKGCQGLLAIHWRTKDVGESQALVARWAWDTSQTLESFYRDYGTRRLGPRYGPEYGEILQELDGMGYRWLGGPGQSECGTFAWCHVNAPERTARLETLESRLLGLSGKALQDLGTGEVASGGPSRVRDTYNTVRRVLLFNKIAGWMVAGGPVDEVLALPATDPERAAKAAETLKVLTGPEFGLLLDLYTGPITSRGESGMLATVVGKAWVDYRNKVARLRGLARLDTDTADLTQGRCDVPLILTDYQHTSVAEGTPLTVRCVAMTGGTPAAGAVVRSQCRGDSGWRDIPMVHTERCIFEATIPGSEVRRGWLRYSMEATGSSGLVILGWPVAREEAYQQVTVFPAGSVKPRVNSVRVKPEWATRLLGLEARVGEAGQVLLTRAPRRPLQAAGIERRAAGGEWVTLGENLDWEVEDAAAPPDSQLEYRLVGGDGRVLASASVTTPAAAAPRAPAGLQARARGGSVRLEWAAGDLRVDHYSLERAEAAEGGFAPVESAQNLGVSGTAPSVISDRPGVSGLMRYRVVAHGVDGRTVTAEPVEVKVTTSAPAPLLALEFEDDTVTGPTGEATFSGPHEFGREAGRGFLRTEGGFELPYGEALAVEDAFTVAIRFRQTQATPIPVLVSQGAWEGPGWFVQLMGPIVRFYVSGVGCLDRTIGVPMNQWHTLVGAYDGASLAMWLDGALLGEKAAVGLYRPSTRPFTVARYTDIGPEWTFKGDVDYVRLYPAALEPWMVARLGTAGETLARLTWESEEVAAGGALAQWHQAPAFVEDPAGGRALDLHGGLTIPYSDLLASGERVTVETRFLLRGTEGMPVLVSQGAWPQEGYLVQVLKGQIRFHLGGLGSLDCGPTLETGRWYALKCSYDGSTARAWLDGELVGEKTWGAPFRPSTRPLRIGRYEADETQYRAAGLLGAVTITAQ